MSNLNAGKASVLALTAAFAVSAFLLGKSLATSNLVYAKPPLSGVNGECDLNSTDDSHDCEAGLICVELTPGKAKSQSISTSTPTATPTASPSSSPSSSPSASPSASPSSTPSQQTSLNSAP